MSEEITKEISKEIDIIIVSLIKLKEKILNSKNQNPKSFTKGRFKLTDLPSNNNKEENSTLEKGGKTNKYRKIKNKTRTKKKYL
jgi:hypothetical protein